MGAGEVTKREGTRRRAIARQVAEGTPGLPIIVFGENADVRREILRKAVCYLNQKGTCTCMLQLSNRSAADAFADLTVAAMETNLDDDAPRAVVCDGLPLGDESFDRSVAHIIELGAAKGILVILGVTPGQARIADALRQSVSFDADAPESPERLPLPLHTYLHVKEAAMLARTSESYIYDLIRKRRFTDVERRGRRILIRTLAFLRYLGLDEDDIR